MKLVLVSSPALESPEALPLGAACVAAAIGARPELASVEVALVSGKPGEGADELLPRVASEAPEAVGLSVYSWNRRRLCEVARRLRALDPSLLIFAGGPEATADPPSLVAEAGLDFAIAGEGETAACEALAAFLAAGTREGLSNALRDIAGVVVAGAAWAWRRAPPEDPAALPSPWLAGDIDPRTLGGDAIWELSRGCPFKCAYCYESKGQSGSRPFPMPRIESELELFAREGIRYLFVLDPTFDADPARARELLDLFRAKAPGMRWKFELRAELLDKGLVKRLAALDCSLQIGLQSARAETLAAVGRPGFDRKDFSRKAAMLGQAGVSFGLDLIYGLPGDGLADFEESLDYALGLGPNHLDVFPLALLPGTELAERSSSLGLEADPAPPYLVRSTRELPAEGVLEAARLASACDRFYSAGRAVAWFEAARGPLRLRASELLRGYASYLERRGKGSDGRPVAIEAEQIDFLTEAYRRTGLDALVPALRDLVRLHGAWGRALAEGEESLLELAYDPEEVLGASSGLAAFVRAARPERGSWRVLPDEEEGARIEPARGRPERRR